MPGCWWTCFGLLVKTRVWILLFCLRRGLGCKGRPRQRPAKRDAAQSLPAVPAFAKSSQDKTTPSTAVPASAATPKAQIEGGCSPLLFAYEGGK